MKLPPTGPSTYISACSGVALGVKMDASKNNAEEELSSLVLDWDDDWPMSDKCGTGWATRRRRLMADLASLVNMVILGSNVSVRAVMEPYTLAELTG